MEQTNNNLILINNLQNYTNSFINYLDLSQNSLKTYATSLNSFFIYCKNNNLNNLTSKNLIEYKNYLLEKGQSAKTINTKLSALRCFFNWLNIETNNNYKNITIGLKNAKTNNNFKKLALTKTQINELFKFLDPKNKNSEKAYRDYAIFYLLLTTALRLSELTNIKINDFYQNNENIYINIKGKGHNEKDTKIKITPTTEKIILNYLKFRKNQINKNDYLFTSLHHNFKEQKLSLFALSHLIKNYFKQIGINTPYISAHSTRHTAITNALNNGSNIYDVSQFARHKSIATTQIYIHTLNELNNNCVFNAEKGILLNE